MELKNFLPNISYTPVEHHLYVVIPAAGLGLRMGISDSKQFLKIQGVPVLARTLQAFATFRESMPVQLHAVLVTNTENLTRAQELVDTYQIDFVEKIVEGGATRQDSVACGIAALGTLTRVPEDKDPVFIHDGARCMVDTQTLISCYTSSLTYEVCVAATPCKNTIKCIRPYESALMKDVPPVVDHTLDRDTLYEVQTPQAFHYDVLCKVSEQAKQDGICATDDTALAEACGIPVHLIPCSYGNIKITTPEDVVMAEFLLSQKS